MVVGETRNSAQTSDCDSSTIDVITRDHFSGLHAAALMRTGRNTCAKRVANNGSTVRPAPPPLLRHLRQPELPEFAQLRRCLKLGVKLLKRASKRVRQAPHTSRRELRILRLEVQPVDVREESARCLQFAFHKCSI